MGVDPSEPNLLLSDARARLRSPRMPQRAASRADLAELVSSWMREHTGRDAAIDARYIGKLERGTVRLPGDDYRAALRAVLGVASDTELGFCPPGNSRDTVDDVKRHDFLRATIGVALGAALGPLQGSPLNLLTDRRPTTATNRVGRGDVEQVRAIAGVFGAADAGLGGGMLRVAVTAQLDHCARLLDAQCAPRTRQALFAAVGDLADVAAFAHFDAGDHPAALRAFQFALACADTAREPHLAAKVLSNMARQATHRGDTSTALTLVEHGLSHSDRLTPVERADLLIARARAHAALGHREETLTAIGKADDLYARARAGEAPAWMAFYDNAQHAGDTGHALTELVLRGGHAPDVTQRLEAAVTGHTGDYIRSKLLSQVRLASVDMATGDPYRAVEVATLALADAPRVQSTRLAGEFARLRSLADRHQAIPQVAQLRKRLTTAAA